MTSDELKALLHYDSETGVFTWIAGNYVGKIAGGKNDEGYIKINIKGKKHGAHRLAWLYMTGRLPEFEIDHINGCTSDNRFINLRHAKHAENCKNRKLNKNSSTGAKGVSFRKGTEKYRAYINVDGKRKYLGDFNCPEIAALVASEYRDKYHGEFVRAA